MAGGLKRYACFAVGFLLFACSDGETTGTPGGSSSPGDGSVDRIVEGDARSDGADSGRQDASIDAPADAADAGIDAADTPDATDAAKPVDAAVDAPIETGRDGSNVTDAAPDSGPRCLILDCDDHIDCTVDSCDEASGCIHTPSDELCDDNRVCTGTETCSPTAGCQAGTPLVCADTERCTFDYCAEPAGCAHQDVSATVELLTNANFDYGKNIGWVEVPPFSNGSVLDEPPDPAVAHTPPKVCWLGGQTMDEKVYQQVEVPAATVSLTLSGYYILYPSGTPSLQSSFAVDVTDALSGVRYERPLLLASNQTNTEWTPFSVTTTALAGKVLEVNIRGVNKPGDNTHYLVDSMSMRARICPLE